MESVKELDSLEYDGGLTGLAVDGGLALLLVGIVAVFVGSAVANPGIAGR